MAWRYVRSTDGSDADNGSTWALADASIVGSAAGDAAGDIIAVSQSHAGSYTTAQSVALAGTLANPVMVIGVNDGAEPPTAESTTAVETITNNNNYTITGAVRWRKVNLTIGASGAGALFILGTNSASTSQQQLYEEMTFRNDASGSNSGIQVGDTLNTSSAEVTFRNVTYYPVNGAANKGLLLPLGKLMWEGGGLHASSVAVTVLVAAIGTNGRWGECLLSGLDLSAASTSMQIFPSSGTGYGAIANCILPASWSGTLSGSTISSPSYRVEMFDCIISGGARLRYKMMDNNGSIREDTGIYLTSTVNDGVASVSYLFAPTASSNPKGGRLVGPSMVVWNGTTGSPRTVSVDVAYDSATTLLDNELWLEACTLQTSGSGQGTWTTGENTNALATGTALSTVSTSWTGTSGWSNEKKHTLTLTFTPQQVGPVLVRLVYAKNGPGLYCDPTPRLS